MINLEQHFAPQQLNMDGVGGRGGRRDVFQSLFLISKVLFRS